MREKLFANWGLKLVALFVAFGLWYVWAYSEDPLGESTFTNIEVQFLNADILQEENLVSEVLDGTDLVRRVKVKGRRKTLDEMRDLGANVIATADYAKLNKETSTIPITFSVPSRFAEPEIEITQVDGSPVVKLLVEELTSKNVRVSAKTTGTVMEGYQIVESHTQENTITVSGGKSKVDLVDHAAVVQDVSGANDSITSSGSILLFDKDDNRLDTTALQRSLFTTGIEITIRPTKEVPVYYEPYGVPADGYAATGVVEGSMQSVKVVGNSSILNSLDSIVVTGAKSALDITGATENKEVDFNIYSYLPGGVSLAADAGDGKVKVIVYIEPMIERTYKVLAGNIQVLNLPEGMIMELPYDFEVYDLTLRGLEQNLAQVAPEQLTGIVDIAQWMEEMDLEEISSGTYYIQAEFILPEGVYEVVPVEAEVTLIREEDIQPETEEEEGVLPEQQDTGETASGQNQQSPGETTSGQNQQPTRSAEG